MCSDMKHGEITLVRLKRRADFLRVARTGRRHGAVGLVLQTAPRHGRTIDRSEGAAPNHDYVLIGRTATLQRPYAKLRHDLLKALGKTGGLTRS